MILIALALICHCLCNAGEYHSQDEKTEKEVLEFAKTKESACRYLSLRDIPPLMKKHVSGAKALDFGSGIGISTIFLFQQGFKVDGADISQAMLLQARKNLPYVPFYLVEEGSIPIAEESYDLVFSCYVLFELSSKEEIVKYLSEAKRVMKNDGIFIAVTASEHAYSKDWYIYDVDFPENKQLTSGELGRIYLKDADIAFTDFYWTEGDFREAFSQAGLHLIELHYPLGKDNEPYPWKDEKLFSPYVIFVAKRGVDG